jgi:predicted deacylase
VLVNGAEPGPRVAVTSGIHGAEYTSIAALRRVANGLDPAAVRGCLVAVLVANPAAFAARSIYVDPLDGRNLNRVFPGDPAGTASERLAAWILETVMVGSDAKLASTTTQVTVPTIRQSPFLSDPCASRRSPCTTDVCRGRRPGLRRVGVIQRSASAPSLAAIL